MILAGGRLYETAQQAEVLAALPGRLARTLESGDLRITIVLDALDRMAERIAGGAFDALIEDAALRSEVGFAAGMLRKETLLRRLRTELGEGWDAPAVTPDGLTLCRRPLGVLLHIAAGNMDALPAFSVIEGLLSGNINLLKLPQADSGLTIRFFQALLQTEPALTEYIYVFDTPSSDISGMQQLAACSDGIAVWGGDAAVSALRRLAPPGCRLIEWGHRLGFAYLSGEAEERPLRALADHIIATKQLLCSSCQVIYLDTAHMDEVHAFCRRFLPLLEEAARAAPFDIGAAAELTLRRYTEELEGILSGETPQRTRYTGKGCSLTACPDSRLELSEMFGNVLVKPLPRASLLPVLRESKGYLQTAGLLCDAGSRAALTALLLRSGVNRVLEPGQMSGAFPGEPHDGDFPLQRYTRIALVQHYDSMQEFFC